MIYVFKLFLGLEPPLLIKRRVRFNFKREILAIIFLVYLIGVAKITLFPASVGNHNFYNIVNLIPFVETVKMFMETPMHRVKYPIINVVGNIILLLPLGFLLPLLWDKFKSRKDFLISKFQQHISSLKV